MSFHHDNSKHKSFVHFCKKYGFEGLDSFKNNLEKHFFSTLTIRDCADGSTSAHIALELDCNFSLTEMLHHFDMGTWGSFGDSDYSFTKSLEDLREKNDICIEIEEFSIFFKDTTIVINKIYNDSVPQQLEAILKLISQNYIQFTKGLTEIPYEIYVPVFEEGRRENDTTLMNIKSGNTNGQDYFKYWGLYFNSEDDAMIFDLKNTSIVSGDLQMINGQ